MINKLSIIRLFFAILALHASDTSMFGQESKCEIKNNYFGPGEELQFNLYFKYGLIYTKAGDASLVVSAKKLAGRNVHKMVMTAATTGTVRSFFPMNDTLTSYVTPRLVPLLYVKHAHEGGDFTQDMLTYDYSNGYAKIRSTRQKNNTPRFDEFVQAKGCIYDLLSVVYYARTLDYSTMRKGDNESVEFMDGRRKVYMLIEHQGIEQVKTNDGNKYDCVKLVLSVTNASAEAFDPKDKTEAMKVYITNDNNRMPTRMEFKLKIGGTRGILKSYKGNLHPVNKKN